MRKATAKRSSEPVTIERIEDCLALAAYFVVVDGPVMIPIFERLERELEALKRTEATIQRARQIVEANRHRLVEMGAEGKKMNRLKKFVEQGGYGEKSGRTAFAWKLSSLPEPHEGMTWHPVESFSAADELIANAGLTEVFKIAIAKGCAVVSKADQDEGN